MSTIAAEPTPLDRESATADHDVAIVGSGFSGLAMAVRLLRCRACDDFVVLERAADVGGTWRDNSYPGCACDVPSHLYSSRSPRIRDGARPSRPRARSRPTCAASPSDAGVLPHVRFGCELEERRMGRGTAALAAGDLQRAAERARADRRRRPAERAGRPRRSRASSGSTGRTFHSAAWDHDHDLTGERVAVIGTGASAIQFVPQIQPRVARLHLFQRTAPWVMPRRARPLSRFERALYRRVPGGAAADARRGSTGRGSSTRSRSCARRSPR